MSTVTNTATQLEATIARRIDFPTWLPAMLVKELRQGLRQRGFVAALVLFQIAMTICLVFAVAGGTGSGAFTILQGGYWTMIFVQLLIITPMRALAGLQAELDSRWVDLVMLTRLTAWRIVLGKWMSLMVQATLLVIAMLPYGVAQYFFGSVDLIDQAQTIAKMLAGSALLTAAALWSSALPKLARVGLAIGLVFLWQVVPTSVAMLLSVSSGGMAPRSIGSGPNLSWGVEVFDILLLLVLCLVGAVRRLAPRAESQTPVTRVLALGGFLALPFLRGRELEIQAVLAGIFFAFIAALELGRPEEPMAAHWRTWSRRGRWGRVIGRFVQPGWVSASEWLVVVVAIGAVGGCATLMPWKIALLLLFAAEGLIFPMLLLTWMSNQFTHRLSGYALLLVGASILSAVGHAVAGVTSTNLPANPVTNFFTLIDRVVMLLPIASFWTTVNISVPPPTRVLGPQIVVALVVLGGAWLRARPYRAWWRSLDAAREEAPVA